MAHTLNGGEHMEADQKKHALHDIKYHVIWVTKKRSKILSGPIAIRVRELIKHGCEAREIIILQGIISKDFIHLFLYFLSAKYSTW